MPGWVESWWGVLLALFSAGWGSAPPEQPASPPTPTPAAERTIHTVAHVIDGDTIVLQNGAHVRLLGIDTPEREECYYQPAGTFLRDWIGDETIELERDVRNRDEYDRLLRYVYIHQVPDGTPTTTPQLVNQVLLERGYATILPIGDDRRYRDQFRSVYEAARAAERGRWGACAGS